MQHATHVHPRGPASSTLQPSGSAAQVHFAKLDVGEFPSVAKRLGVDPGSASATLPCALLFESGQEVARVEGGNITKLHAAGAFDLDRRFTTSMGQGSKEPSQTSSAAH